MRISTSFQAHGIDAKELVKNAKAIAHDFFGSDECDLEMAATPEAVTVEGIVLMWVAGCIATGEVSETA